MRGLLVRLSALMCPEIVPRREPLGLERVTAAVLADGHDVPRLHRPVSSRHG